MCNLPQGTDDEDYEFIPRLVKQIRVLDQEVEDTGQLLNVVAFFSEDATRGGGPNRVTVSCGCVAALRKYWSYEF